MQTEELLKCFDLPIGSEDPHSYPKNELGARAFDHKDWIRFTNIAMQTHARFEPATLQEENAQARLSSSAETSNAETNWSLEDGLATMRPQILPLD